MYLCENLPAIILQRCTSVVWWGADVTWRLRTLVCGFKFLARIIYSVGTSTAEGGRGSRLLPSRNGHGAIISTPHMN